MIRSIYVLKGLLRFSYQFQIAVSNLGVLISCSFGSNVCLCTIQNNLKSEYGGTKVRRQILWSYI
uniref:Uncharacterized protein n=1 Tax=Arundo donax TaxID=35708 RepID=A0A0A9HLW4_ARUDO